MKLYIAGHNQIEAITAAKMLGREGHSITSRWLWAPFNPTEKYAPEKREEIATMDADDVTEADALVLLSCEARVPGGKFVEAGIALGQGKEVFVIGRRENMLLWHPRVYCFATIHECILALKVKP